MKHILTHRLLHLPKTADSLSRKVFPSELKIWIWRLAVHSDCFGLCHCAECESGTNFWNCLPKHSSGVALLKAFIVLGLAHRCLLEEAHLWNCFPCKTHGNKAVYIRQIPSRGANPLFTEISDIFRSILAVLRGCLLLRGTFAYFRWKWLWFFLCKGWLHISLRKVDFYSNFSHAIQPWRRTMSSSHVPLSYSIWQSTDNARQQSL